MSAKINRRDGQILVMVSLTVIPLFGILGLVTDLLWQDSSRWPQHLERTCGTN